MNTYIESMGAIGRQLLSAGCKHSSCYSLGLFSFSFRHFSIYFTYKHPYIYDTICMISSIFIDYRYESKEQTENDMLCKTKTY